MSISWTFYKETVIGERVWRSYRAADPLGTLYKETIIYNDEATGQVKQVVDALAFVAAPDQALDWVVESETVEGERNEQLYSALIAGGKMFLTVVTYIDQANGLVKNLSASIQAVTDLDIGGVVSVNSQVGIVVLTTDDVSEGSLNLYYTNARFDTRLATKTTDDLAEGATNKYFSGKDTDQLPEGSTNLYFSGKDSDDLPEGMTNLYFTPANFSAALATKTTDDLAEGITNLYFSGKDTDDLPEGATNLYFSGKTTTNLPEGTNLYYTNARFDTQLATKDTDDLAEGATNLYFSGKDTDQLPEGAVNLYFSGKSTDDLIEGVVNFYFTNARFDTRLATKTTDNLAEGTTNKYFSGKDTDLLPEGSLNFYYSDSRFSTTLATKTTDDLAEGATNKYFSGKNTDQLSEGVTNLYFSGKDTDDLPEGASNFYYTTARFNTSLASKTTDDLAEGATNKYFSGKTTTNLPEGTNLYYTDARFDTRLATKTTDTLAEGAINLYFSGKDTDDLPEGASNFYFTNARFDTRFGTKTTDNLNEGATNLYFTNSRFDTRLASKTTDDLAEGSVNFYFTNARFDTRFGTKTTTDLAEGTNLYYTASRFNTSFAAKTTTDLAEGSNLYFTVSRARDAVTDNGDIQVDGAIIGYKDNATSMRVKGPQAPSEGGADVQSYSGIFYSDAYVNNGTLKTRVIHGANLEMDLEIQSPHQVRITAVDDGETDGQVFVSSKTNTVFNMRADAEVSSPQQLIIDRVSTVTTGAANTSAINLKATANLYINYGVTAGAMVIQNLTTAERNAITPVPGMIIFNTTLGAHQGYAGSWISFGAGGGGGMTIGDAVSGGTPDNLLFVDASGDLGQSDDLKFDAATGILNIGQGQCQIARATVNTTDDTLTTLQTIATVTNSVALMEFRVTAHRTGGTAGAANDLATYVLRASIKNDGGTVTIYGPLSEEFEDQDWDADLFVSGTNVLLRVTGAIDNNITWKTTTFIHIG